jgi:hypothetical protein
VTARRRPMRLSDKEIETLVEYLLDVRKKGSK